jgi:hypothetical protein
MDLHLRRRVGGIRTQLFAIELASTLYPLAERLSDNAKAIEHLARHLDRPGESRWFPKLESLDQEGLRRACLNTSFHNLSTDYIETNHYAPLLRKTRIPIEGSHVSCTEWLRAVDALRTVASVLAAARRKASMEPDEGCCGIAFVPFAQLVEVLCSALQGNVKIIRALVDRLVLAPEHKNLELWDQPLVRFGDHVLLVPTLIHSGSASRAIENIARQWAGPELFSARGGPFEEFIFSKLSKFELGTIRRGVTLVGNLGEPLEFDIVWLWEGHLFLIEAKCVKSVIEPSDYFNAKQELDKAIAQLDRRLEFVSRSWPALRAKLQPEDKLGEMPLDRIHPIAVLNAFCFTGRREGPVLVTDDRCLLRYFGDPNIYPTVIASNSLVQGPSAGRVRGDDDISPASLVAYLEKPGHVDALAREMKQNVVVLPPLKEGDSETLMLDLEFAPPGSSNQD